MISRRKKVEVYQQKTEVYGQKPKQGENSSVEKGKRCKIFVKKWKKLEKSIKK